MLRDPDGLLRGASIEEIRDLNENKARGRRSRPVSFYDNIRENSGSLQSGVNGYALQTFRSNEPNPSQAQCLNTTVPQNITGPAIAGKHAPTRNSLRHSRMIVMSRNGRGKRRGSSGDGFQI